MSVAAALALYAALGAGAWAVAGTAGVVAAVIVAIAIEKRLARLRALDPYLNDQEIPRAHR